MQSSTFAALYDVIMVTRPEQIAVVAAVRLHRARIVDAIFYALTIKIVYFDKNCKEDVETLTHPMQRASCQQLQATL